MSQGLVNIQLTTAKQNMFHNPNIEGQEDFFLQRIKIRQNDGNKTSEGKYRDILADS